MLLHYFSGCRERYVHKQIFLLLLISCLSALFPTLSYCVLRPLLSEMTSFGDSFHLSTTRGMPFRGFHPHAHWVQGDCASLVGCWQLFLFVLWQRCFVCQSYVQAMASWVVQGSSSKRVKLLEEEATLWKLTWRKAINQKARTHWRCCGRVAQWDKAHLHIPSVLSGLILEGGRLFQEAALSNKTWQGGLSCAVGFDLQA